MKEKAAREQYGLSISPRSCKDWEKLEYGIKKLQKWTSEGKNRIYSQLRGQQKENYVNPFPQLNRIFECLNGIASENDTAQYDLACTIVDLLEPKLYRGDYACLETLVFPGKNLTYWKKMKEEDTEILFSTKNKEGKYIKGLPLDQINMVVEKGIYCPFSTLFSFSLNGFSIGGRKTLMEKLQENYNDAIIMSDRYGQTLGYAYLQEGNVVLCKGLSEYDIPEIRAQLLTIVSRHLSQPVKQRSMAVPNSIPMNQKNY